MLLKWRFFAQNLRYPNILIDIAMKLPQLIIYIKTVIFLDYHFSEILCFNKQMRYYLIKNALYAYQKNFCFVAYWSISIFLLPQ